ncbi:MAG: hypothetical protein ACFFAJ_04535 [Candidatus Hodarchaeota archaeon]
MFGFPIEIKKYEWPFDAEFDREEIIPLLNQFFGHLKSQEAPYEFYSVTRPDFGLVRPVMVLSAPMPMHNRKAYYTIRITTQPDPSVNIIFDLPSYQKNRIEQLVQTLKDHYPAIHFIESNEFFIVIQNFIFLPVCKFNRYLDIVNLIEIIWLASSSRVLLDYNQNHWLTSENGRLYYVDKDFMGDFYPNRDEALGANINQAMIFFNLENCEFLPQVLKEFASRGSSQAEFVISFKRTLKQYITSCQTQQELSERLQKKLKCLGEVYGE